MLKGESIVEDIACVMPKSVGLPLHASLSQPKGGMAYHL